MKKKLLTPIRKRGESCSAVGALVSNFHQMSSNALNIHCIILLQHLEKFETKNVVKKTVAGQDDEVAMLDRNGRQVCLVRTHLHTTAFVFFG